MIASIILVVAISLSAGHRKVLLIGIDGVRADALERAKTPTIDWIYRNGFGTMDSWHQDITISGPSWSSILCGVYHDKHGVKDNKFENKQYHRFPMLPIIAKSYMPELKFGMYMEWNKLIKHSTCQKWDQVIKGSIAGTSETASRSAEWLKNSDLDFYFVYFGAADYVGHISGFTRHNPFYRWTLESIDDGVNELIKSLAHRPNYHEEDWLILLTTDHGGTLLTHGGLSAAERQVFWLAYSDRIQKQSLCGIDCGNKNDWANPMNKSLKHHVPVQPDIAVTALHHLLYNTICRTDELNCWSLDGVSWLDQMGMCNDRQRPIEFAYHCDHLEECF
ncbi:MAG: alkaline phosphatase family protein [Saprospiraceae bacterium]|nr:alkaline phosphatase family protein [Saprospiraceae bacterium]